MSVATISPAVADLLDSFESASPDRLDAEFGRLAGALWSQGAPTGLAASTVPALLALLDRTGDDHRGRLAVLLGVLAETDVRGAGGEVAEAVRAGLDRYLDLLRGGESRSPLTLALLYLVSHFPADRERILAVAAGATLDQEDLTRLERALRLLDPDDPDLGRCWPAPSVWSLDETERRFDQRWIRELTPEQVRVNWDYDTQTVLAYSGAKAYWAARHGTPAASAAAPIEDTLRNSPRPVSADIFRPHAEALRCPGCRGPFQLGDTGARCDRCATSYPIAHGILDLSAGVRDAADASDDPTADLLQKLAEMPSMGLYYEAVLRPAFLRIAGGNWGAEVTPEDEYAYIAEHVRPVDGPVLDLAAGAGRWTEVVARTVGADRLIALDAGLPMLNVLRRRLADVPAVLGDALALPFEDASLGAVNCWNALQAFPEDAGRVIGEVGRCLRPGGTFTMMTFRFADDPLDRHFQEGHHFPSRPEGMLLFEVEQIRDWLEGAGMTVRDLSGPGSFVFVTAVRR